MRVEEILSASEIAPSTDRDGALEASLSVAIINLVAVGRTMGKVAAPRHVVAVSSGDGTDRIIPTERRKTPLPSGLVDELMYAALEGGPLNLAPLSLDRRD